MSDPLPPEEAATLFYSGHPMAFVDTPGEPFVCGQYQGQLALITKLPFDDMAGATAYFTDNPVTLAAPPVAPTFAVAPILSSLSPDTVDSGAPDFTLSCVGSGFTSSSVIVFGTEDEPTTLVSEIEVTTIVKPSLFAPAVVPVTVRNEFLSSDPVNFTFTDPDAGREVDQRPTRPDRYRPQQQPQVTVARTTRTVVRRG